MCLGALVLAIQIVVQVSFSEKLGIGNGFWAHMMRVGQRALAGG